MVEYSNLFVVLMGLGVVFFGLTCIVFLTLSMGKIMKIIDTPRSKISENDENCTKEIGKVKPEIVAIITSVLSEEIDTSESGLNILDIHKL